MNDRRELYPAILERAGLVSRAAPSPARQPAHRAQGRGVLRGRARRAVPARVARALAAIGTVPAQFRRKAADSVGACSPVRSATPSSASSRAASRWRRISSAGVPGFAIVGLADRACQEAKERVRSGIGCAELQWPLSPDHRQPRAGGAPQGGVELRPADRARDPRGVAAAAARLPRRDGGARRARARRAAASVEGAFAVAEGAGRAGIGRVLCPVACAHEVASRASSRCRSAISRTWSRSCAAEAEPDPLPAARAVSMMRGPDLAEVRGHERARRALEIAAAGRHNLLLAGPPGTGKTMLARRLPGILPLLERDEALEVTRIHSVAGMLAGRRARRTAAVPGAAPQRVARRDRRRRAGGAAGRGDPRASRRVAPGRAARVRAARARVAPPAARGRLHQHRARERARDLSRAVSARRDDESLSVRRTRRCGGRLRVHPAAACELPSEALPRAARPVRPDPRDAAPARAGALRRGRRRDPPAVRARVQAARTRLAGAPPARDRGCDRAARPRGRLARALGARRGRASPGSPATIAALAASDATLPRARRRGALLPRAGGADGAVSADDGPCPRAARPAAAPRARSTIRRRGSTCAARRRPTCWSAASSRSSARAPAPRYGTTVARALGRALGAGGRGRRLAGSRAGSTRPLIAARSTPARRRSRSSAAASTATTRRRTQSSRARSARPASSSRSTRPASSRRRGASPRATGSSRASARRRSSSRRGRGAVR